MPADEDEDIVLPEINLGRGKRNRFPRKVQVTTDKWNEDYYDPRKAIPKIAVPPKNPKPPASAKVLTYGSSLVPEPHCHIVRVFTMLSNNIDNTRPDKPRHWLKAMTLEMNSLTENQVWELVNAPPSTKTLTGRWIFKLKIDRYGNVLKYNARWVAHGYKQQYGVDYEETFAAIAKPIIWKALLALAVLRKDMEINQMDVITAFQYGFLDKVIYEQPHSLTDGSTKVCKLLKSLYGLKQSPRRWFEPLADFLKKLGLHLGLHPSQHDPAILM